jgi:hypothetical protein
VLSASFNQDGEFANDISPNILSKKVPEYERFNIKSSDDTLNSAFDKLLDDDNSNVSFPSIMPYIILYINTYFS